VIWYRSALRRLPSVVYLDDATHYQLKRKDKYPGAFEAAEKVYNISKQAQFDPTIILKLESNDKN